MLFASHFQSNLFYSCLKSVGKKTIDIHENKLHMKESGTSNLIQVWNGKKFDLMMNLMDINLI